MGPLDQDCCVSEEILTWIWNPRHTVGGSLDQSLLTERSRLSDRLEQVYLAYPCGNLDPSRLGSLPFSPSHPFADDKYPFHFGPMEAY